MCVCERERERKVHCQICLNPVTVLITTSNPHTKATSDSAGEERERKCVLVCVCVGEVDEEALLQFLKPYAALSTTLTLKLPA